MSSVMEQGDPSPISNTDDFIVENRQSETEITSESLKEDRLDGGDGDTTCPEDARVLAQFKSEQGEIIGSPFDLPLNITSDKLQLVCSAVIGNKDTTPYSFFVNDVEIRDTLKSSLSPAALENTEKVVEIVYQPQAIFRVQAVSRCTSTIEGHSEAILSVAFSPDARFLASGSGDMTVRFYDINTETPSFVCKGHKHWILAIAWSPDGEKLATGCKNSEVRVWNPKTSKSIGKPYVAHTKWITCLAWKPFHLDADCKFLASASKDSLIRIWNVNSHSQVRVLSGHLQCVSCIKWGGGGHLYSASQDRTIKVWKPLEGIQISTIQGHGHWVNSLALNTDYVMKTGAYEPADAKFVAQEATETKKELCAKAKERYNAVTRGETERMVSGSDDFTLFLWNPDLSTKSIARMTGHRQQVNEVQFSPDGRLIASASFDKSVKLWDGRTGKFISTLRGHVNRVYQIAWSADSRLLVSGSSDTTLKVWDVTTKKLHKDLIGHLDEVYAVDWSPDGQRVASGGKDKVLKVWRF